MSNPILMNIDRRTWMKQSLLASATVLLAGAPIAKGCASERRSSELPLSEDLLLLNWNENPYGPPASAVKAVNDCMEKANRYPDELIKSLKEKIAGINGLKSENVLLTSGSTEVLSLLGQHAGLQKGEIVTPYPTFPTALEFGERFGAKIQKVPLGDNDRIDFDQTIDNISSKTSLVFICNPNNPTGTEVKTEDLKSFCRQVPEDVLVCIDEAYIEYSNAGLAGSMVSLISELPNLLVVRTFSKAYGLAGLRLGYVMSNAANISALSRRHLGFEVSTGWPPLAAAEAALDDKNFLNSCLTKNQEGREIVYRAFDEWGVAYNPSSTNFIYAKQEHFEKHVVAYLEAVGILITKWPDMYDHIRISIGKPADMLRFVEAIDDFRV